MKNLHLLIITIILSTKCFAQDGFFKALPGYNTNQVIDFQDGYLSIGSEFNADNGFTNNLLKVTMDAQGNVLDTAHFSINSNFSNQLEYRSHTMIKVGNEFIVVGDYGFNTMDNIGFLARFNADMSELLNYTSFEFDHGAHLNNIIYPNDSTFIISGHDSGFGNFGFIMNTDMEGNIRWKTDLDCGPDCKTIMNNTVQTSDGGFAALLMEKQDLGIGSDYWRKAKIIKLDETGGIQWSFYPGNSDGYSLIPGGIIQTTNGTLLITWSDPLIASTTGENTFFVGNPEATIYIQEYSIAGITLNYKSFAGEIPAFIDGNNPNLDFVYYTSDLINTADNKALISASMFAGPVLMKITEQGDLEWFNYYFPFEEGPISEPPSWGGGLMSVIGVNNTNDGGYVCSGNNITDTTSTGFVLKVGADGCLWDGCETLTDIDKISEALGMNIYPNPSTGIINLDLPQDSKGYVEVRNISGQLVYAHKIGGQPRLTLNLSFLENGLYIVQLNLGKGNVASSRLVICK